MSTSTYYPEYIDTPRQLPPAPMDISEFDNPTDTALEPLPVEITKVRKPFFYNPAWIHQLKPIVLQHCPEPRIDAKPENSIRRIKADIEKSYRSLTDYQLEKCTEQIGRHCGEWISVATDGHRALLVRGAAKVKGAEEWQINSVPKINDPHFTLQEPAIMNALKRLATLADKREEAVVTFTKFEQYDNAFIMSASNPEISGTETAFTSSNVVSFKFSVNPHFLLPALGMWPLRVYFSDVEQIAKSPLILMPDTRKREWMYVVMPVIK